MPKGIPKAFVYVDGQNLYYAAKAAFGYSTPNYDVRKLSQEVCRTNRWLLGDIHFYTGVPSVRRNAHWYNFWTARMRVMRGEGIKVVSRPLSYRTVYENGQELLVPKEKGIDVRLALDATKSMMSGVCDVVVIFSQDQDLAEIAKEARHIQTDTGRCIVVASVYPYGENSPNPRGIDTTKWIKIPRQTYDKCLDERDYFLSHHS